jgi:hypothetical protein
MGGMDRSQQVFNSNMLSGRPTSDLSFTSAKKKVSVWDVLSLHDAKKF